MVKECRQHLRYKRGYHPENKAPLAPTPPTPTPPPSFPGLIPAVEDVLDRVFKIKDPSFAGIAPRKTSVGKPEHEESE